MSEKKIGRVYKLVAKTSDECYIGSTINKTHLRFASHKTNYKNGKCQPNLKKFIDKYGINNIDMILIKEYEIVDIRHLRAYEQLWINRHKKNVNFSDAFTIKLYNDIIRAPSSRITKDGRNKQRERYLKLKAQIIKCECGKQTNAHAIKNHLKSKFHQSFINSNSK